MSIFNKIVVLSKQIASSLLKDEEPTALKDSNLFNESDKNHILEHLTNETLIRERLELTGQIDAKKDWKHVENRIDKPVKRLYWRYAAAAAIVSTLAIGYYLKQEVNVPSVNTPVIVTNNITTGTNKATLTLDDGTEVILDKNPNYSDNNISSNGKEIIYNPNILKNKKQEIAYNYLTIPRGGQYFLKLSDGTKVWLNSESKLKYPVSFVEGESRVVELVYGEAYFEVTSSTWHQGSDFKVYHNAQEIQVLGTQFNIKAYKDETQIYTTLVEGKVSVNINETKQELSPNEQSILNTKTNIVNIKTVDVYNEISWKEGVFSFDEKSLKEIMKVLSRWYDMNVVFINTDIEKEEFNGVLDKGQKIEDILSTIKSFGIIKSYRINDKNLILE